MDPRVELLRERVLNFEIKHVAHARVCAHFDRRGRQFGLATVVLTAVVGTSVFTSLKNDPSLAAKIAVTALSFLAAVAAAAKAYMDYDRRAIEHRQSSADYGHLRDWTQQLLATNKLADDEIAKLDKEAESCNSREPTLPPGKYDKAARWVQQFRANLWLEGSSGAPADAR